MTVLARTLFWLAALWLALAPLLWQGTGERFWLLVLFQYAPGWLWLLAWTFLAMGLAGFRPRRGVWALMPALGWLPFLLLPFEFRLVRAPGNLKVITYNIQAGLKGPEALARWLAEQKADVIALQEARRPSARPGPDPVPILHRALPGYSLARSGPQGELVVLTRRPMRSQAEKRLGDYSSCQQVEVGNLRIINVHFMTGDPLGELKGKGSALPQRVVLSARTRRFQAEALVRRLQESPLPTVVTGDFNSPPTSLAYRSLRQAMNDGHLQGGRGWGLTFPAHFPCWRIDYIWSRGLAVQSLEVIDPGLSDHRAVVAELQLPTDSGATRSSTR